MKRGDCIEIDVYPQKFELLLVLGGSRNTYYHRVLSSGGIEGWVLDDELNPV